MKSQLTTSPILDLVATWWTPVFVAVFIAALAYALWPRNRAKFDAAARMPLED